MGSELSSRELGAIECRTYGEQADADRAELLGHIEHLDEVIADREKELSSSEEEVERLRGELEEALGKVNALEAPRVISDCVACKLGMRS